ncbi:hypothetical protein HK096_009545, partial [Nowakowskiella sp. JEL0078]
MSNIPAGVFQATSNLNQPMRPRLSSLNIQNMNNSDVSYLPSSSETYTVIQSYETFRNDELLLRIGDRVILNKVYNDGWCEGARIDNENSVHLGQIV